MRIKDVDFGMGPRLIRDSKGNKDRVTMLPAAVKTDLAAHIHRVREQHQADLRQGAGGVEWPGRWRSSTRTPAAVQETYQA